MSQHRARTTDSLSRWFAAVGALVVLGSLGVVLAAVGGSWPAPADQCPVVRVVAASSFAPVLAAVAPALASGPGCAQLDVTTADGRGAASRAAALDADVWIPDDAAWRGDPGGLVLAEPPASGAGTVLATSPVYLVADPATARAVTEAGGGWHGLAGLVTAPESAVRLVARDPGGSGDGLLGLGSLGESVWEKEGMDASAELLAAALPRTRIVADVGPAIPGEAGEVGLVAERTLLTEPNRSAGLVVLAPTDRTAELRYSWYPTADVASDPARADALARLATVLAGPGADGPLAQAGLRRPGGGPPAPAGLPPVVAPAFDVLGPHHVDHVLATWYPADRRADVLVAVDVSGSMWARAAGGDGALIEVVRQGVGSLADLLPDDSRLELWEFGSHLDGTFDHRVMIPRAGLAGGTRAAVSGAIAALTPTDTGTGLHDTILAAYRAGQEAYRDGTASHVVVFTDGRNEADTPTLSPDELANALASAADPRRPVHLAVITFGAEPDSAALTAAVKPVGGYVDRLRTADEVGAAFIHVAAGGLHG